MADFKKLQPGDPEWLAQAFKLDGLAEAPGDADNPVVVGLYAEAGHPEVKSDGTAWCAALVGAMLARAGYRNAGSLLARSYLDYGGEVVAGSERRGDLVVFKRGNSTWQGHIAFFLKFEGEYVWVYGGNQKDALNAKRYKRDTILGIRRPGRAERLSAAPIAPKPAKAAPRKAGAAAGATKALTLAVQNALIAKGYHEVGIADGDYGSKTRGAILAFEADHGLELTGQATAAILTEILAAEPREVSTVRGTALPEDKSVITGANVQATIATCAAGAGVVKAAEPIVTQVEATAGLATRVKDAVAPLTDLIVTFWPIILIAGAGLMIYLALQSKKAVVRDFRNGKITR